MSDTTTFADLGLRAELLAALSALGYEEPTPIQRDAIPPMMEGRDVLGQAATGTGKTAAFALPILQRIESGGSRARPMALVLVPTRELAVQVSEATWRYGRELRARVLPIYGGQPIGRQLGALRDGVHVVVATPGRAIDHIQRGTLALGDVQVVVLDEADEMLDMGFAEDIEAILDVTPADRQTVLFSATLPPRIATIAKRHLREPVRITIERTTGGPDERPPLVRQRAFIVTRAHKSAALGRILDVEAPAAALVFCRTRNEVDQLTETMSGRGYRAEALHGGMSQEQRDRVMGRLRAGTAELLIATDVAARGLDVDVLTHVINYDVPSDPDAYVHRIGRVGRAGREGVAITLAEPREQRLLANIERATSSAIAVEKVPSVAELRARQIETTTEAVRRALTSDDLTRYGAVVDELAPDGDVRRVAEAALKRFHELRAAEVEEADIPEYVPRDDRPSRERRHTTGKPGGRVQRSDGRKTRLFIGLGRSQGIRPGDLVGAIANESDLSGKDIGPIRITERFSTVDVPEAAADAVIAAIKQTTIKGKRPTIRRDRDQERR
ncbi:MAG: DEAD/DEAH box helicase [Acidimicrobiia bacterium]|nr:DEAD/DEAH box helicase [Acidimicrobiia bacterium]